MSTQATAIYKEGLLRLLTPISLPERPRVRIQILSEEELEDDVLRAEEALIAAAIVKPPKPVVELRIVSQDRRAELARLYAAGGPLSEAIIDERDAR